MTIMLFAIVSFSGNALAAWSFNISTDYAAGDSQAVFNLNLTTDETVYIYDYYTEFTFDNTELLFTSYTNTPVAGLRADNMMDFSADQNAGTLDGFNAGSSGGAEVTAGNYLLGAFTFDVINAFADGTTDFNFDIADRMFGFDFESGWYTGEKADSHLTDIAPAQSQVPVPAALWLLGSGVAGLACFRRKRA